MGLKKDIAGRFGISLQGRGLVRDAEKIRVRREQLRIQKAASAVLKDRKHRLSGKGGPGIPDERRIELEHVVLEWVKDHSSTVLTDEMLERACELELEEEWSKGDDFVSHGEYVVQQLMKESKEEEGKQQWPGLEAFIVEWREHFVLHSSARFLSPRWRVSSPVYNK